MAWILIGLRDDNGRPSSVSTPAKPIPVADAESLVSAEAMGERRAATGAVNASESISGSRMELSVLVVSRVDMRTPIAGARLVFNNREHPELTDSEGRCTVPFQGLEVKPDANAIRLTTTAEGYATAQSEWSSEDLRHELVVALGPEGVISGSVVCGPGRKLEGDVRVIAWRSQKNLASETIHAVWSGRPSWDMHITSADEAGMFHFGRLDPSQRYRLLAVGAGYWATDNTGPIPTGARDVVCRVQTAFGLVVDVDSDPGHSRRVDSRLLAEGPGWASASDGTEPWPLIGAEFALMAAIYGQFELDGVSMGEPGNWKSSLLFYLREDGAVQPIGPVEFHVTPPGCEPLRAMVEVPWLRSGTLPRVQLRTACTECIGGLVLQPQMKGGRGWNARASLVLRQVGTGLSMQAAVDPFDTDLLKLSGVPCGTYDVRLSAYHTIFDWPAPGSPSVLVHVEADRIATIDLGSWIGLGRVEIELVDQVGELYQDSASFDFEHDQGGQSYSRNAVFADAAPYRCALLPATDWAVRVTVAAANVDVLEPRTYFTVLPGQSTKVTVPIRR